jgi:16S rRNA (uracil1498-N3)-methyltransferase
MKPGAEVALFNGDGYDYPGTLSEVSRNRVQINIRDKQLNDRESSVPVTLAQGISRGDRMDYTIQKAVELGVTTIIPLYTERSVGNMDDKRLEKKLRHWEGVIISACEQCGRSRIPDITTAIHLPTWLTHHDRDQLCLTLDPLSETSISHTLWKESPVTLLIGPEGGLSAEEIELTKAAGFKGVRLGPRILRTETAAVAALAAIQSLWGDFS